MVEAISKAKASLATLTDKEFNGIIGVSKEDDGWKVTLELIERKSIPDSSDMLGIYEIKLDETTGEVVNYSRIKIRRRGDADRSE